jgi:translation elongation factor EF-Ts
VAKTDDFKQLGRELAMQITSMGAKNKEELLKQAYIRDSQLTVDELIKQAAAKLGENIQLGEFVSYRL